MAAPTHARRRGKSSPNSPCRRRTRLRCKAIRTQAWRKKVYAAYVTVTSTRFTLIKGTDLDVGVRLQDCGGWSVGEWHDHAVLASPAGETRAR